MQELRAQTERTLVLKEAAHTHLCVLPGRDSDVGVGADGGRGVEVIGADVIEGVTETTAHRAAVVPAKSKTCSGDVAVDIDAHPYSSEPPEWPRETNLSPNFTKND